MLDRLRATTIKYRTFIGRAFATSLAYRSEVILWLVLDLMPMYVMIFVWTSIFASSAAQTGTASPELTQLGGYQLGEILQYYFLAAIINIFTSVHFEVRRVNEIREGKIDFFLTRPLGFITEIILDVFGHKSYLLLTSGVLLGITYVVLQHTIGLAGFGLSLATAVQVLILILAAFIIECCLGLLVVMAGFWFEYASGLEHFKWFLGSLFSGAMIPLVFMPEWLEQLTLLLPFKFMYALPIGLIQGTLTIGWQDWVYLAGFILCLMILVKFSWHKAKYQYTSQGG